MRYLTLSIAIGDRLLLGRRQPGRSMDFTAPPTCCDFPKRSPTRSRRRSTATMPMRTPTRRSSRQPESPRRRSPDRTTPSRPWTRGRRPKSPRRNARPCRPRPPSVRPSSATPRWTGCCARRDPATSRRPRRLEASWARRAARSRASPRAPSAQCPWFASANWLIMGRDKSNRVWTTYQADYEPNQLMHSWDTKLEWESGGEVRFGRRFCCDQWGLEAVYWTLNPMTGFASMSHSHGVSTPLRVSEIEFDGVNGVDLFDDAEEHRLWRRDEFHNIELNLIRYASACQFGCPWDIRWTGGVRFFRFEESLRFGSLDERIRMGRGRRNPRGLSPRSDQEQPDRRASRLRRAIRRLGEPASSSSRRRSASTTTASRIGSRPTAATASTPFPPPPAT